MKTTTDTMQRIETLLREHQPVLKEKFKVKKIGIFGSYLRGTQKKNSDLDLLVEFSEPVSLFDFIRLKNFLTDKLGTRVDLVMADALKPRIRDQVAREALYL